MEIDVADEFDPRPEDHREATSDEAFELGWVAGFNAAYEAVQYWSFTMLDKRHVLSALDRVAERWGGNE